MVIRGTEKPLEGQEPQRQGDCMATVEQTYTLHSVLDFANAIRGRRHMLPLKEVGVADNPVVFAVVNHGRWICQCPFCAGAEMLHDRDRLFMCMSCWNEKVGGQLLKVKLPRARAAIEQALLVRPLENRIWEVGETVAFLLKENERIG